jgi:hypothetical protein
MAHVLKHVLGSNFTCWKYWFLDEYNTYYLRDTINISVSGYKQIKCLWDPKNAFYEPHLKENDVR